jgi:hypothetical protein
MEGNPVEMHPYYLDLDIAIKQPQILYRANIHGGRYYYSFGDNGDVVKYPSVTSILSETMPTSDYLIKWIAKHGIEKAEEIKRQKADYGTLLHIILSQFLKERRYDLSELKLQIEMFKLSNRIDFDTRYWEFELKKDIYAFHKFAADYQIKPIAIGIMLQSHKHGIAGEIDVVVEMSIGSGVNGNILKKDIKDGNLKRITVLMDWKSGKHGFYPNNEAQLHLYKLMWQENFPHIILDGLYNWAPKEWDTNPDYYFKDQSASIEATKIFHYIDLFKISETKLKPKIYNQIDGVLELGHINGNLKTESFEERARRQHNWKPLLRKNDKTDPHLFIDDKAKVLINETNQLTLKEILPEIEKQSKNANDLVQNLENLLKG